MMPDGGRDKEMAFEEMVNPELFEQNANPLSDEMDIEETAMT